MNRFLTGAALAAAVAITAGIAAPAWAQTAEQLNAQEAARGAGAPAYPGYYPPPAYAPPPYPYAYGYPGYAEPYPAYGYYPGGVSIGFGWGGGGHRR